MELDGLFVEAHGSGDGPEVVLVHGAPDRSKSFRALLPHLDGVRVVLYDRRGYGRSASAVPATGMVDHANDLLAVVEGCDAPPVVVAHSFGSNPTMLAVTLRPEAFAAVGLWEPPLPWVEWWPERTKRYNASVAARGDAEDAVEEMYRQLLGEDTWLALPSEVRAARRAEGPAFRTDMGSELEAPFRFDDVEVPALVGYGTETAEEHVEGALWLAERLPDARSYCIAGTRHFAPRTDPEEYAGFVRAAREMAGE